MRSELVSRLRALYRGPADGELEHRRAGEDAVVAAFERRARPGAASPPRPRWPRLALASVLGVALAVGACALPSEYPVDLGQGVEIVLSAERFAELDPEQIAAHLGEEMGAERIEVHLSHSVEEHVGPEGELVVDEQVRMQLFALGGEVGSQRGWDALVDEFPALADAEIEQVPLSGVVHGTLGGRLSRDLLDLTIDRHGVEEAEARILAELRAEGIAPADAKVDITTSEEDGHRRIEVRVEATKESGERPGLLR